MTNGLIFDLWAALAFIGGVSILFAVAALYDRLSERPEVPEPPVQSHVEIVSVPYDQDEHV